jgi:hypothetical protein
MWKKWNPVPISGAHAVCLPSNLIAMVLIKVRNFDQIRLSSKNRVAKPGVAAKKQQTHRIVTDRITRFKTNFREQNAQ